MLVRFSVENFRSIKSKQTLFLSAVKTCKEWADENTSVQGDLRLLRTAVVYGANASGKTNLLLALERMRAFMLASVDMDKVTHNLLAEPFLLSAECLSKPETFEIQFTLGGKLFTYGFGLILTGKTSDQYEVSSEWLIETVKKREHAYFLRERRKNADGTFTGVISVNKERMPMGVGLEARTRPDALFLTVAAQFAEPVCQGISDYVRSSLHIVSGLNHDAMSAYSKSLMQSNADAAAAIKKFVHDADTGVKDIAIAPDGQVMSLHDQYDGESNAVGRLALNFQYTESLGTRKLFNFSGGLIDTLANGHILVVDELDAGLHPMLVRRLVMLFNDARTNPRNAQLVVNVQSPDLLAFKEFYPPRKRKIVRLRRDQFFFVEKDNSEASVVSSLIEFRSRNGASTRNDAAFDKDYMEGLYGGVPHISELVKVGQ